MDGILECIDFIFCYKQQLTGSFPGWLFSQTESKLMHLESGDISSCLALLKPWDAAQ